MRKKSDIEINFRVLSRFLFILLLFTLLMGINIGVSTLLSFKKQQKNIRNIQMCEDISSEFRFYSNELIENSRLFVITKDFSYLNRFLELSDTEANLKTSMEKLAELQKENYLTDYCLKISLEQIGVLKDIEIYAIRLLFESDKELKAQMPPQIAKINLREIDKILTPEKMNSTAVDSIFGKGFTVYTKRFDSNLDLMLVKSSLQNELTQSNSRLIRFIYIPYGIMLLLFILLAVVIVKLNKNTIIPFQNIIESIKKDEKIVPQGIKELKLFANIYNSLFDSKKKNEMNLLKTVEHDQLTGVLNRYAFDKVSKNYKSIEETIAFCIIDIDDFKTINDSYGHKAGDHALIRLGRILTETFRKTDFVFRIGGDEFTLILTSLNRNVIPAICSKFDKINELLSVPEGDTPAMSISCGIVISDKGYYDELFKMADTGLYEQKHKGKHGYFLIEPLEEMEDLVEEDPED